jgi:hypothetical protein
MRRRLLKEAVTLGDQIDVENYVIDRLEEVLMGSSRSRKEFLDIVTELKAQKWHVTETGMGHWRAAPPDKKKKLVHFGASDDPRAIKNAVADLRASGFLWPATATRIEVPTLTNGRSRPPSPPQQRDEDDSEAPDKDVREVFHDDGGDLDDAFADPSKDVPDVAPSSTEEQESTYDDPSQMDQLWGELKEAKGYLVLAENHVKEKKLAVDKATQEHKDAQAEAERARTRLKTAKSAFDSAFSLEERR